MAPTPAAVPNSYAFIVDMPGLKSRNISGQIEENNVLVISGNRKRELEKEDKEGLKYVRMERLMRKFALPKIAKTEKISAVCLDDVLTVKVEKLPPARIGKPTMIQVQNA